MANTQAGKIPGYETTFITRPELSDDGLKALGERVKGIVAEYGGEIVLTEDWGKRKLAYPMQKETRGHYTYVVYTGKGDIVHEIERNLRIHEHVLRFLSVNLEKEFEADTFRKFRSDLQAAAKRREEEREARREERAAERRAAEEQRGGGYRRRDEYEPRGGSEGADEVVAASAGDEE